MFPASKPHTSLIGAASRISQAHAHERATRRTIARSLALGLLLPCAGFVSPAFAFDWFPAKPGTEDQLHLLHHSRCTDDGFPSADDVTLTELEPGSWELAYDSSTTACGVPPPGGHVMAFPIPAEVTGNLFVKRTDAVTGAVTTNWLDVPERVSIPPSVAGTWFSPTHAEQGLLLNYTENDEVVAAWTTYDADGQQAWHSGIAANDAEASGSITVELTDTGTGVFAGAEETPEPLRIWGEIGLTYHGCGNLELHWAPAEHTGLPSGQTELMQLTRPPVGCDLAAYAERANAMLVTFEPEMIDSEAAGNR